VSACLSQVDVGFYLGLNRSYAKEVAIGETLQVSKVCCKRRSLHSLTLPSD
jgi:hypothetical protein